MMRLDKFLSHYAEMTRKEAKEAIKKGRITVDGLRAGSPEQKVDGEQDICLDGKPLQAEAYLYYMMNKRAGVLSATKDTRDETVLDDIANEDRRGHALFPVGRLDKDTVGLLILTDDGKLANQLLSPRYHVEKTYYARYEGELDPEAAARFLEGIDIGEPQKTKPAVLEVLPDRQVFITISEGKYHQVKRMMARVGGHVTYLKRVKMAGIPLDEDLPEGSYRPLTESEIMMLKQAVRKES